MNDKAKYVVLVSAAGIAALAAWYLARRNSGDANAAEPLVVGSDGLEPITVTAQRLPQPSDALPRGVRNNNPGNLRYLAVNAYNGQTGDDGSGYGIYASPLLGMRALALELRNDYTRKGLQTIDALITEWAPPSENPTVAYINAVSRALNTPPNRTLTLNRDTWHKLCAAIIRQEQGGDYYTAEAIDAGLSAAGIPA